jgi:hypothetical protein
MPAQSCAQCGIPFEAPRSDARFCSSACRQLAYRIRRDGVTPPVTDSTAVTAPVTVIDWDSLPAKAKDREAVMRRVIRKELEKEFRTRQLAEFDQYRAQCDANVAAYKAAYDAQNQKFRALRDEVRRRYQEGIEVQRAKGLITPDDYNVIRSCLHPDSRASVTDEKLAAAFRLFNDSRIKTLLVKESAPVKRRKTR